MIRYLVNNFKIVLVVLLQIIIFISPLVVMMCIHKDAFWTEKTGWGVTGFGILGIIIFALCIGKVIGKLPKYFFFVFICAGFYCAGLLADWLFLIAQNMLIGATLACPLNIIKKGLTISSTTELEERSRDKYHSRKVKVRIGKNK